jgi:hypothetical protein
MTLSRFIPGSLAIALATATLAFTPAPAYAADPIVGGQSSGDVLFPGVGNTGYDVSHYDLDIDWTAPTIPGVTTDSIAAVATIEATTTGAPLSQFSFDLEGLTVGSVTVNGAAASFTRVNDAALTKHKLVITPATPVEGAFTTVVTYSGTPLSHTDPDGSSEGWGRTPDGVIFLNQPVGSMTAFPNNNTPSDKATYEVSLEIPSTINAGASAAVSNGELASRVVDGTRTTWNWVQQEQMASMAMLISIGRYNMTERNITLASGRVLPEWTFIDPNATGAAGAATAATNLKAYIDFFETRYGPYPGNSTGVVVDQILPTAGINYALETQDRAFFPNSVGTGTNIHETMHQWWGDAVAPVVWNDIWISEGAASFSEVLYPNESTPQTSTTTTETSNYNLWNSTAANSANWTVPPADMGDGANLFGWQTYNRSEMTFEELKAAIGTSNFDTVMFEWNDRFTGQSPGTAAFIDLAEEISGKDLTAFFQDWIYDPDKPAWPGKFDLSLTPSPAGSPIAPESAVTYTLSAVNTGRVSLSGAVVEVDVADVVDDADLGTLPGGVTLDADTLVWAIPTTATAAAASVDIPVTLKAGVTTGTLGAVAAPSAPTLGGTCTGCATSQTIAQDPIDPSPVPTVTGTAQVGQTLTAETGTWAADTTFAYQWTRDGQPIDGADAVTYEVVVEDLDAVLRVVVTGSKTGFADTSRTSEPTAAVVPGHLVLTPIPTITGTAQVGQTLTAHTGTWDDDVTFAYQWKASDQAIAGAVASTYIAGPDDINKQITVVVTGAKPGYNADTRTSDPTTPVVAAGPDDQVLSPTPSINGKTRVGKRLRAVTGTYDPGTTLSYRWFASGSPIPGATKSSYRLKAGDLGKRISVAVTSTKPGFNDLETTSAATGPVTKGQFAKAPKPVVRGKPVLGNTLRAKPGRWAAGVALKFRWYAAGRPIAGETRRTLALTAATLGKRVWVVVVGTKPGYLKQKVKSAKTTKVTS